MQQGPGGAAHRPHHVPALFQEFGDHGMAKAARGTNEQNAGAMLIAGHDSLLH